ncbi:MAG: nucleotidyltransferase family protein [Nitrospirae bacterium]|nr:nucleotidyltransferase family protein [Nitrospirota bacterium]
MSSRMSPEQRLLLLLIRPCPSVEVIKEAEEIFRDGSRPVNIDELYSLAAENGVASLIFRNSINLQFLPQDLRDRLKNAYYSVLNDNAKHLEETFRISDTLKENGIESIVLKGSPVSEFLFGDAGVYPTGDIDILLRPADIRRADGIISGLGYEIFGMTGLPEESRYLHYQGEAYYLDLHLRPATPYFDIPGEFWWADPISVKCSDRSLKSLSGERYLLFSINHLLSHQYRKLKFFVLIDAVIRADEGRLDWHKVTDHAERFGMKRLVFLTLKLLHEMTGVEVPEYIRTATPWGYGLFRYLVFDGLFKKTVVVYLRHAVYLALLAGPDALLKIAIRAIFPGPARMRARYGLPPDSKMVCIYYILNPFFILFKRT